MIVDPHPAFRDALVEAFSRNDAVRVVAALPSLRQGVPPRERIDVVLLALDRCEDFGDVALVRRLLPNARVLLLSPEVGGIPVVEAFRSGAAGFVPKSADAIELLAAVAEVASGRPVLHASLETGVVVRALRSLEEARRARVALDRLTPREHQVLLLLAHGRATKDIAVFLSLSARTIESHLERVYRKLGVAGRLPAVREYWRLEEAARPGRAGESAVAVGEA